MALKKQPVRSKEVVRQDGEVVKEKTSSLLGYELPKESVKKPQRSSSGKGSLLSDLLGGLAGLDMLKSLSGSKNAPVVNEGIQSFAEQADAIKNEDISYMPVNEQAEYVKSYENTLRSFQRDVDTSYANMPNGAFQSPTLLAMSRVGVLPTDLLANMSATGENRNLLIFYVKGVNDRSETLNRHRLINGQSLSDVRDVLSTHIDEINQANEMNTTGYKTSLDFEANYVINDLNGSYNTGAKELETLDAAQIARGSRDLESSNNVVFDPARFASNYSQKIENPMSDNMSKREGMRSKIPAGLRNEALDAFRQGGRTALVNEGRDV